MAEDKKAPAAEAEAKPKTDSRKIMITDPDTGQPIARVDYCRREVMERGVTRGDVARKLTEIQGKPVAYQIVFAATKDFRPPKKEKPVEAEAKTETKAAE